MSFGGFVPNIWYQDCMQKKNIQLHRFNCTDSIALFEYCLPLHLQLHGWIALYKWTRINTIENLNYLVQNLGVFIGVSPHLSTFGF